MQGWLIGVYQGELAVVGKKYVQEFWKDLRALCESPFLEKHHLREFLVPYFFFIEPVPELKRLGPFHFKPSDWGLSSMAYMAIEGDISADGKMERGGLRIAAKGRCDGGCFAVDDVPARVLQVLETQKEKLCALALIDRSYGTARTGTFFRYRTEGSRMRLKPIMRDNRYLVGKGILAGAWPGLLHNWTGGMNSAEYDRETYCPLTIGGAVFKRPRPGVEDTPLKRATRSVLKGSGTHFYIAYRGVETDLRLDMPAALLHLKETNGFELLARNLGRSIDKTAPHIRGIVMRNVLADGHMVDYADIDPQVTIGFDERSGEPDMRVKDAFSILYLCAVASRYGAGGMRKLLAGKKLPGEERRELAPVYSALCEEFLKGLGRENTGRFSMLRSPELLLPYFE